jgi:sigma-B regulation protein RsbU (phosphoserine phosphatase)
MASLQASLRSQCAGRGGDPLHVLRAVNRLFFDNTPGSAYATLFFGDYDDRTRRLRYVNCGHPAALVVRRDGSLLRLDATGSVIGLFEDWTASVAECDLQPGDVAALYTDGITESPNEEGEEFGDERLIRALREHGTTTCETVQRAILDAVREFSPHEQSDDRTVIVMRGK